ncbi:MAG: glycosyltransferase, partial [Clostridia bacterium]
KANEGEAKSAEEVAKSYEKVKEAKQAVKKPEILQNIEILESREEIQDAKKEPIYTFLNVGRHTEQDKRLTRIIESAKRIKGDGLKFRILFIGDGRETANYKEMVEEYKLQEEIIFLGRKKNPYPYFKIADSLLLTSQHEGFPVVYTEAMVLGLPIITTDVSDSKKVIDNKYGIVVEKNIDAIYNAMKKAITEGIICNEKFDGEQFNKEIKDELEKLIEQ